MPRLKRTAEVPVLPTALDVPFNRRIWTAKEVSVYLGVHYDTFMKRRRFESGFPEPLPRFPSQPRWSAKEVAEWALWRDERKAGGQPPPRGQKDPSCG